MYGLIFTTVKDLVLKKFGEAVWLDLLAKANLAHDFAEAKNYDDAHIYTLLTIAAQELKTTVPELQEAIGYWFPIYVRGTPYGKVLSSTGNSLAEIIKNINTMHGHIKYAYFSEMCPPTFRCTREREGSLYVHYLPGKPTRKGLSPLLVGILKSLAEETLGLKDFKIKQKRWIDKGAEEDVFVVRWKSSQTKKRQDSSNNVQHIYGLDPAGLNKAFPFHILFNKKLEILQFGKSLNKLVPMELGSPITNYFRLVSPARASFEDWKFLMDRSQTEVFIFEHDFDVYKTLQLKGQLIWQPMLKSMCFVGSPLLDSIEDLNYFGLGLSDFAAHDSTKDALFMNHNKEVKGSASLASSHSSSSLSSMAIGSSATDIPVLASETTKRRSFSVASESSTSSTSSSGSPSVSLSGNGSRTTASLGASSGCPFSNPSLSPTSNSSQKMPELKQVPSPSSNSVASRPSPPPTPTSSSGTTQLKTPQTSSSLLDKLFGSKQKSSYGTATSKKDSASKSPTATVPAPTMQRPQPLRSVLSSVGQRFAADDTTWEQFGDEQIAPGARKRSKSCSDSDELLAIEEDARGPLSGLNKLGNPAFTSSTYKNRGIPLTVSDEDARVGLESRRQLRASPHWQPATYQHLNMQPLPPAAPLSLQGRERLENAFQELILADARCNFKLAMEMLNTAFQESNIDRLVYALLEIYNFHGKSASFIQTAIAIDVRNTNDEGVLMRSETIGTRALSLYLSRTARDYVRELVEPLNTRITGLVTAHKNMELLPNRAPSEKHTQLLLELAQNFLEETCRSADKCPLSVRRVLRTVGEEVARKFPHMQRSGILNLLFLRILTPAILSSAAGRRIQLLVTKLIQNLANDVPFDGRKEEHMKAFNVFISESNQQLLQSYVSALIDEDTIHEAMNYNAAVSRYTASPPPNFVALSEALSVVRDSLTANLDKIWKMALTDEQSGAMLRQLLSVGLCQMFATVGRA